MILRLPYFPSPILPEKKLNMRISVLRTALAVFCLLAVTWPAFSAQAVDGTFLLRSRKAELDNLRRQQYLSDSNFRAQIRSSSRGNSLLVGESEVGFQVYNFASGCYEYRVGRLVAQGAHCHLFVERESESFFGERAAATYVEIVENFDNRVFKTVDSWFGRPRIPAEFRLPDDRVYIFLVDIKDNFAEGYVAGYFDHRDLDSLFGNQKPVFFMDLAPGAPGDPDDKGNQFYRTLSHEMQHMVNFSLRLAAGCDEQERWLDEGFSMFCEYVYSGQTGNSSERWPPEPHFARFLESPAVNLITNSKESWFREDFLFRQYGASFAFVTWLVEKYGGERESLQQQFVKELIRSREKGATAINNLLVNTSFEEVFANFIMSLHVESSGNSLWEFNDTKQSFGEDLAALLPLRFVKHYFANESGSFVGGSGQAFPNCVLLEEIYGKGRVKITLNFEEGMTPFLAEMTPTAPGSLRRLYPDQRGQVILNADFDGQRRYFILPLAVNPEFTDDRVFHYSFKSETSSLVLYPVAHPLFSDQILVFLKSFSGPIETPPTLRVFFGNLIDTPEFIRADAEKTTFMAHYQLPGDGRGQAVCYYGDNSCSFSFSARRSGAQENLQLPLASVYLAVEPSPDEGLLMFAQSDAMQLSQAIEVLAGPFDIILPESASAAVVFDADIYRSASAGWCRVDESGVIVDWQPLSQQNPERCAMVGSAGRFFLLNDRLAPDLALTRVRQVDACRLLIDITASDDLSGIDFEKMRVLANGRPVEARYLPKSSLIELQTTVLDPGENELSVELSDRAGNQARASIIGSGVAPNAVARAEVFPNPCRNHACIKMSFNGSPMINQAEVKLYDAAGHHLATLPLEQESSDVYSTVWDLLAKSGKRVSNGVYFYRITAAADAQRFRASGKIAVLR